MADKQCPKCMGTGCDLIKGEGEDCPLCQGKGEVEDPKTGLTGISIEANGHVTGS